MKSILVGLDGSADCWPAVELGIRWAKGFDSLLVGIGVIDEPALRGGHPEAEMSSTYRVVYDRLLQEARHGVEQTLERFALRCGDESVACKLLEDEGLPCEQILMELQRYDLLIFGCKTHFSQNDDQHTCQTLEKVLRSASRPVVLAPKSPLSDSTCGVVVAYDGSVQAARALSSFVATGLAKTSPVHIVSVHPESSVEAAKIADRAAEYLRFHDIIATCVPKVGNPASSQFLGYANEIQAELIVMGAYGQARVKEFFFGSATCTALQESTIPLFLFH